eukprot:10713677-Karenia_brevis.AAC.1
MELSDSKLAVEQKECALESSSALFHRCQSEETDEMIMGVKATVIQLQDKLSEVRCVLDHQA